jgi:peptidoglycan-associated lipoprotein
MIVGVLLTAVAATLITYGVRSRGTEEAPTTPGAVVTAPAGAPTAPGRGAVASTDAEVVHTDVYFDVKSARLRADAVRVLQKTAAVVDRTGAWVVLVQGHADRQGSPEFNKVLAQRRAEAVKQFLVELGVPDASVKVVTIGKDGALCDDTSKECDQINRRVHVELRKLAR